MESALPENTTHSARRDRSIRLAVVTSFLSKAGTILFQLLAVPVAMAALTREGYGVYATVGIALSTVIMLEIGIGPALAHGISSARAQESGGRVGALTSSAFFLVLGMALLVGLVLSGVLLLTPLPWIFGDGYADKEAMLRPALWTGLGLLVMLFVLNLTDRIREGLLQTSANNSWGALGNLIAVVTVAGGIGFVRQVWFLVLAVYGSLVIAKVCNTIALWRAHPEVRPAWTRFQPSVARHLLTDGVAFSACTLVTGVVEYNLCGLLVGRQDGPAATALYQVFISITVMQLGVVMMLSTPTWPAVAEALARGDVAWAKQAARKLYLFGSAFAACAFGGLVLFGPWVFSLWLGKEFSDVPRSMFACYGLYFVAHVWRHLNHALMFGTGQVGKLARVQLTESALVAAIAVVALKWGGIGPMLAAMGVAILAITGIVLPRIVARGLAEAR